MEEAPGKFPDIEDEDEGMLVNVDCPLLGVEEVSEVGKALGVEDCRVDVDEEWTFEGVVLRIVVAGLEIGEIKTLEVGEVELGGDLLMTP